MPASLARKVVAPAGLGVCSWCTVEQVIVDIALYRGGHRVELTCHPHDYATIRALATEPGDFVWLGLYSPSHLELAEVAKAFDLHPLAVEDAVSAHQRPKLERYDSQSLFLVLKTLWYVDADDQVETGEIAIFARTGLPDHRPPPAEGSASIKPEPRSRLIQPAGPQGPSAGLWAVADHVVDTYLAVLNELSDRRGRGGDLSLLAARTSDSARIYTLKRELAEARRADPSRCANRSDGLRGRDSRTSIRTSARSSATCSTTSRRRPRWPSNSRQCSRPRSKPISPRSRCSRTTTCARSPPEPRSSWCRPSSPGVYGMNFEHMPELSVDLRLPVTRSCLMALAVLGLWIFFKKSGWL